MTKEAMTKESLTEAIKKSKATTISGLWKALGHKSAISGSQGKKIRELVPNHQELFEANKKGDLAVKEESNQVAVAQKEDATTKEIIAPKAKKVTVKKEKVGGFRAGSNYAVLFAEGSKEFIDRDELIAKVAKLTGREETLVAFDLTVMDYPSHTSNKYRTDIEPYDKSHKAGLIKIVPYVKK